MTRGVIALKARNVLLRVLAFSVVGYAAICAIGCLSYRRMLYPAPPPRPAIAPEAAVLAPIAADGETAHALYFAAPLTTTPTARTFVFFHGNGEQVADSVALARDLVRRGFGAVLVEYRGYGALANGRPTEQGLYLDAVAVLDTLAARGVASRDVVLWGTSLGSGVAAEMAARGRGAALVLVTPYTSIPNVAARIAPFLPTSLLIGDKLDTLSKVDRIRLPTLIIHGDHDDVVPYDMGVTLSQGIAGARLITVRGAHHNDLFARDGAALMDAIGAHARL